MILMIIFSLYILSSLIKAIIHKREDSLLIFAGIGLMLLFSFVKYFFLDSFVRVPNPVGALLLMFFYSLALARRFSNSHYKCEQVVEERTRKLHEANKTLSELATTDPLTLLYNRRFLFKHVEFLINDSMRNDNEFSVILFDIDNFKKVNDTYGHIAGDEVLKSIGKLLFVLLRKSDIAARFGGEEFIICLSDTDVIGAAQLAEKIRQKISELVFISDKNTRYTITASFGVASFRKDIPETKKLIEKVDKALYDSKQNGKNRVTIFDKNEFSLN
jgi:diguanylate cyclase (GGDEF)-like protein